MNYKKYFILAYTRQNLGDDIFIYILLKKYLQVKFHINIEKPEHAKAFKNFTNLIIHQDVGRKLTKENAKEYDGYIYIGGSIFMEGIGSNYTISEELLSFMRECKQSNIPFHYVSSNFGPYKTQEYVKLSKEVFRNCTSIHFRDKYSSNLFSDLETVYYAPDLIFSYSPKNKEKIPNSVGVSVIDLSNRPNLVFNMDNYYKMLEDNVKEYILDGKTVTFFSFCKHEGDERAIQELMNRFSIDFKEKINIVKYNGDIEHFLEEYSKMEYMICSRFHSMILSSVMNQKCKVISYSNKIDNVINDLNLFRNNILHFNKIDSNTKLLLSDFEVVDIEKIQSIAKQATKQLEKVDKSIIKK